VLPAAVEAARTPRVGSTGVIVPDLLVDQVSDALRAGGVAHGVLGRDATIEQADPVDVVPASLAKGLEFDHVVLLEPERIVGGEPDRRTGLRLLYVCLTRAVTSLVVLHSEPLPSELGTVPPNRDPAAPLVPHAPARRMDA
jgi:hypothetical protein